LFGHQTHSRGGNDDQQAPRHRRRDQRAIALKLLAGTAHAAVPNGTEIDGRKGRVLLTVLHDASAHHARGIAIAGIDGEIV
jgi:hypothetical protein